MPLPTSYQPFAPQEMTDVRAAILVLKNNLSPRLVALSPEEDKGMVKLGDGRVAAVDLIAQAATSNPNAFPPGTFDVNQLAEANEWRKQLDEVQTDLQQLVTALDDTRKCAGSRAILLGLTGYALMQSAAKVLPGLKDTVKSIGEALRRKIDKPSSSASSTKPQKEI